MSGLSVYVLATPNDQMTIVIEDTVAYEGGPMAPRVFFEFLKQHAMGIEYTYYFDVTPEQLQDPIQAIYGDNGLLGV